jgi:hypothetical protein
MSGQELDCTRDDCGVVPKEQAPQGRYEGNPEDEAGEPLIAGGWQLVGSIVFHA